MFLYFTLLVTKEAGKCIYTMVFVWQHCQMYQLFRRSTEICKATTTTTVNFDSEYLQCMHIDYDS